MHDRYIALTCIFAAIFCLSVGWHFHGDRNSWVIAIEVIGGGILIGLSVFCLLLAIFRGRNP